MHRDGLISASALLLLGLIMIMVLHEWDAFAPQQDETIIEAPALIIEAFSADVFDERGLLQYRLTAHSLTQFDHQPETLLEQPQLELRNPELVWQVSANRGQVTEAGRLVYLHEGVKAEHHGNDHVKVSTEGLYYRPSSEQLHIPGNVHIQHQLGYTQAGSMEADIRQGVLTFSNRVETHYEPGLY